MASLIEQLQAEALNPATSVEDLLRKAYLVATKLGLSDAKQWIEHELNGYPPSTEVPAYRVIKGQPNYWNPYRGWSEIGFANPENQRAASQVDSRSASSSR